MEILNTVLVVLVGVCLISLVLMLALTVIAVYNLRKAWRTSPEAIGAAYSQYRRRHPRANEREVLMHVIRQQARRCGVIGVFTSFGGFLTMALALPVDLYLTSRIQTNLALFIAQHYGQQLDISDPGLVEIRDNLSMTMASQIARGRQRLSREAMELVVKKVVSKFIPFFGAIIGYRFNYQETKETGQVVLAHYARSRQYISPRPLPTVYFPDNVD